VDDEFWQKLVTQPRQAVRLPYKKPIFKTRSKEFDLFMNKAG